MTASSGKPTAKLLKYTNVRVAELADAQDLGSCGLKAVRVQPSPLTHW